MKFIPKIPSRSFKVGKDQKIVLQDTGEVYLQENEQITLMTDNKKEYDICRKEWGYYATPSINDRLKNFGFKTALVKNEKGQIYVMIIEDDKLPKFLNYLCQEKNQVVKWLDEETMCRPEKNKWLLCPVCNSSGPKLVKKFDAIPPGETDFGIKNYYRELYSCVSCMHVFNMHGYTLDSLYEKSYSDAVYNGKIKDRFLKIVSLPTYKSDNALRVQRICSFFEGIKNFVPTNVLDIGSGLCVFLYELKKKTGWSCLALDPDARQAQHAREVCGIESVNCSIFDYKPDRTFSLITLNKILEHFENPLMVLKKVRSYFVDNPGYLYLEVPDGEQALLVSSEREEFFVEHYHAFSFQSLQILLKKSGWVIISQKRLQEPSGKYTIFSFLKSH